MNLDNLCSLYEQEEDLRNRALDLVAADNRLQLHMSVIGGAMNLADVFRQFPFAEDDVKAIQILAMRTFNALGASLKLALSGYGQNSYVIMRGILETIFLLNLFDEDRTRIERWRCANEREQREQFYPVAVRRALDNRDGFQERKRQEHYDLFSKLAVHPTMESVVMMRPQQGGDAQSMPFIEPEYLARVLGEMGRLAMMFGDILDRFFPATYVDVDQVRAGYENTLERWLEAWSGHFQ